MKISLMEDLIAQLSNTIDVVTNLQKTKHARDRQTRHGYSDADVISDDDIKKTVNIVIPKIARALIFNRIDIGDDVLVKNSRNDINVVGNLAQAGPKLNFIVITVMKKRDFKPKPGTFVIDV